MAKLMTEIKVTELDQIKTLLELLGDNIHCMQEPLISRFKEWVNDEDKGWVSWSDIAPEFIDNNNCYVFMDGTEQMQVTGYNKVLRKVKIYNKEKSRIDVVSAKSFSISNIGADDFIRWNDHAA